MSAASDPTTRATRRRGYVLIHVVRIVWQHTKGHKRLDCPPRRTQVQGANRSAELYSEPAGNGQPSYYMSIGDRHSCQSAHMNTSVNATTTRRSTHEASPIIYRCPQGAKRKCPLLAKPECPLASPILVSPEQKPECAMKDRGLITMSLREANCFKVIQATVKGLLPQWRAADRLNLRRVKSGGWSTTGV